MKKYYLIFFYLIIINNSFANDKIVYLDVALLINKSDAGKFINKEIQEINKKNIDEFKNIEISIKNEEEKLLKQKNILKEEEFNNKVTLLREKYKSYQELQVKKNKDLVKLRENSSKEILKVINIILTDYSKKNEVTLILDKKSIVIGKTQLDVTEEILSLLNNKIKKVELLNE